MSTLSVTELCIVMNILVCIFIFTCLVSVIFAFYGQFIIDKLSLEKRFPKLSSVIRLRVKFLHFYVITNLLMIVIGLILIFYVNVMTLISVGAMVN